MAETTATWAGLANNQANSHLEQGRSPAAERAFNALSAAGLRGCAVDCCVFSSLDLEACGVADEIFICFVCSLFCAVTRSTFLEFFVESIASRSERVGRKI